MGAVVVGVDGSDESMDALRFAATEAGLRRVPLRVVHAFTIPATGSWTAVVVVDLGSVGQQVVLHAPCPVAVVRGAHD